MEMMMKPISTMLLAVVLTAVIYVPSVSHCARILAINPFPARSHMTVFSTLTRELHRRGHEMVVVSPFPLSKPIANYTDINTMPAIQAAQSSIDTEKLYEMNTMSLYQIPFVVWNMGLSATNVTLNCPEVRALPSDERGFDLVYVEAFMNEALYGFASYFKAPLVVISPFGGFHFLNYWVGNPLGLAFVPNAMLPYSDEMNFSQRLVNVLFTLMWDVGQQLFYLPRQEAIRKEFFGNGPDVRELEKSVSLLLLNNHFTLNYPRPLVPSIIEVGGMHVSPKAKPLPHDIKTFLDESKYGVIYFSMGSNLRSDAMTAEKQRALLDAFAVLPQRILWKWESDSLPGQPANVKINKWLPQQDILAHPNVKTFITHGGLLSAQEAIYHGVPLVCIPIFGDQSLNARRAELGGYGITIEYTNITKTSMVWALNRIINDPKYTTEARRRSAVYRDQPETPLERAVFWTEYVLRHPNQPLRTAAMNLNWFQLHLVDVFAVIALIVIMFLMVVRATLKFLLDVFTKKSSKQASSSKKRR